jgi:hypothetical protein
MMALAVGLGAAAFDFDVRRRDFSWRQVGGIVALVSLGLSFLPVMSAAVGGRWGMPRSDHAEALSFLDEESTTTPFRVVWLGASEVLPLGSWPLIADTDYATTLEGTPVFQDGWPGPPETDDAPLRTALDLALDLDTTRLGRILAPAGVRYVVVIERSAPAPYGGVARPTPSVVIDALEQQLDLVRIELNPDITLYRNAAWSPRVASLPEGTVPDAPETGTTEWARQAAGLDLAALADALEITGPAAADGRVGSATEVLVGSSPEDGWEVTVDGDRAPLRSAFGWAVVADTEGGGDVAVSWSTAMAHRLALVGQVVALLLVLVLLYLTRAEVRDRRRASRRRERRSRDKRRSRGRRSTGRRSRTRSGDTRSDDTAAPLTAAALPPSVDTTPTPRSER